MRVIITGGSGLIGRALTGNLAADGYEVIVLSRSPGRVSDLPQNVRAAGWDSRSADGWAELADGATAIVNLASENLAGDHFLPDRWTANKRQRIRQSRLEAGHAVLDAVRRVANKPDVVIQSSAVGYYGTHENGEITEEYPSGDDFLASVARDWEAGTAPVEEHGVRRAIARMGMVLSTEGGSFPRLLLPYRLFVGGPYGSGKQWWSWIHLQDTVRAIRFLIEHPEAHGPFNVVAPEPVQNQTFGRTLGKVLKRPHYLPVPGFALRGVLGEVADVVLKGQRVVPRQLQELGFEFEFPTLEEALRDILGKE
ncbi:MAG: TIGR01777 family oxidoreductase [Anaerolineae bacterium]|nr:TIGR01777 family oxidoreductase [Anaerolineae bacterium]